MTRYFLPAYKAGGPIRTISNLVDHLGSEFNFHILCGDRDSGDLIPFHNIQVNEWHEIYKAKVFYANNRFLGIRKIASLIKQIAPPLIYLNSFFDYKFSQIPLFLRKTGAIPYCPVVLAPRGEFSKGALAIKSGKKRFYIRLVKKIGLYQDITWQASSEYEAADIRREMRETAKNIVIAPDLLPENPPAFEPSKTSWEEDNSLRVIFLSRISPKKNLDFALSVFKRVSIPVEFNIYGAVNDQAYWEKCQEEMIALPKNVKVAYHGPIDHSKVHDVLANNDLFLFPTRGENFGHVIYEALAAGVPALISDQTPWQDLEEKGVGWVKPLEDVEGFVQVISEFARLGEAERFVQKAKARKYASKQAENDGVKQANYELFKKALF